MPKKKAKKKSKKKKSKTELLKTAGKLFKKMTESARKYDKELEKEYSW